MPSLQEIRADLRTSSDRMSAQVRTITLGLLIVSWGLLIGESTLSKEISAESRTSLLLVGLMAVLTMVLDFLQYVFAYWDSNRLHGEAEQSGKTEAKYNKNSCSYKLRTGLFWAKQILVVLTVAVFFYTALPHLFRS